MPFRQRGYVSRATTRVPVKRRSRSDGASTNDFARHRVVVFLIVSDDDFPVQTTTLGPDTAFLEVICLTRRHMDSAGFVYLFEIGYAIPLPNQGEAYRPDRFSSRQCTAASRLVLGRVAYFVPRLNRFTKSQVFPGDPIRAAGPRHAQANLSISTRPHFRDDMQGGPPEVTLGDAHERALLSQEFGLHRWDRRWLNSRLLPSPGRKAERP
jgi:hypothetical protein